MLQHIVFDLGVGCPILKFGHIHIFQRELNPNLFRVDLTLGKQDNRLSESYVVRSEKFMHGVEIMEQMVPGMQEKILSGQFKVRDADMHRLARAGFPNRKQIVHEILHPEDRPAPQKRIYGINYSALEAAVRRIQQDVDFLMKYLPKVPDDAYVKVETTKILKQHKAYMAQFEEMLNDEKVA